MKIARTAAIAWGVATTADFLIYGAAHAALNVPSGFTALKPSSIVAAVTVGAALAGGTRGLLARFSRRAERLFVWLGSIATLLSIIGPAQAMLGVIPGMPAANRATGATMVLMHLVTGAVITAMLSGRASTTSFHANGGEYVRNH